MKFFCHFPVYLLGCMVASRRGRNWHPGKRAQEKYKAKQHISDVRACSNCWGLCLSWMMTISEHPTNSQALLLHHRKDLEGKKIFHKRLVTAIIQKYMGYMFSITGGLSYKILLLGFAEKCFMILLCFQLIS